MTGEGKFVLGVQDAYLITETGSNVTKARNNVMNRQWFNDYIFVGAGLPPALDRT